MTRTSSSCTIWIDVDDLFHYATNNPRPSGIQRQVYEIVRVVEACAARRAQPPHIRFARRGRNDQMLVEVTSADIAALFARLVGNSPAHPVQISQPLRPLPTPPRAFSPRRVVLDFFETLPPDLGRPLIAAGVSQIRVLRLLRRLFRAPASPRKEPAPDLASLPSEPSVSHAKADGDVLLIPGAAWSDPLFGERLRITRECHGLRPVLLMYDLIPLRRPEWCHPSLVRDFRHWIETTLPHCAELLAISRTTAQDVERYAHDNALPLTAPIKIIPIGTGFTGEDAIAQEPDQLGLPAPGSYVLFVSTLEARKNHALLVRVWQRLLRELPPEQVPTLIFAGREGWLVSDLMQELETTNWLDGRVRLLRDPSDAELRQLYRDCLFTVFPSFFEGWGLPVTESLRMGVPCIASHATAIPEAGGAFARYFDPDSVPDATRVIRETLLNRDDLAHWRAHIARDFQPVPWEATADALLDACLAVHAKGATS
ncbi:lipopolysaccharide N-acetylglucosaminyltransferase [Acetobacter estunensis NRIC 0472]|uniref:Glycosyltransferase n=1 Tax=Acetobacter estunensis TaxID=104097 RepID=A0A967B8M1_9PROT|nr:glycosyltransferase family 1 protein [Acetobacter estunensis]NHO54364.1 glycosyltransferase [Acetobacter estunensis]GBQ21831.1 lipopolysaccharide N-acetylglucosaminyltransferase [Acetobacter estunensis NRIC 0472]